MWQNRCNHLVLENVLRKSKRWNGSASVFDELYSHLSSSHLSQFLTENIYHWSALSSHHNLSSRQLPPLCLTVGPALGESLYNMCFIFHELPRLRSDPIHYWQRWYTLHVCWLQAATCAKQKPGNIHSGLFSKNVFRSVKTYTSGLGCNRDLKEINSGHRLLNQTGVDKQSCRHLRRATELYVTKGCNLAKALF